MADVIKQSAPQHKPGDGDKGEVVEIRELLVTYGPKLLVAAGAAVVLALGLVMYQNHRQQQAEQAARLYAGLAVPEEKIEAGRDLKKLQMILDRFPNTSSAPLALLSIAAEQYNAGRYDVAQKSYTQFVQRYAQHPLRPAAEFGRVQSQEAAGQTDLALAGFLQFAAAHTNHYLVPLALFGQARCLEQKKQFADARVVYEDFIARNPHSPWLGQARSALQVLEQRKRAHDRGLPPPASVPRPALVSPAAPLPIQAPPTPAAKPPAR